MIDAVMHAVVALLAITNERLGERVVTIVTRLIRITDEFRARALPLRP